MDERDDAKVSYKNRKGQVWRLFEGKTKLGKPKYFLSQAKSVKAAKLSASIPDGYEIYEKPSGQVFCRKIVPILITDDEVKLVEKELGKLKLSSRIVERRGVDLVVHEPQGGGMSKELRRLYGNRAEMVEAAMAAARHYQEIMKFELIDEKKRLFEASRWYFGGSTDGWFSLAWMKPLADLAKKYLRHIGQESFYELF